MDEVRKPNISESSSSRPGPGKTTPSPHMEKEQMSSLSRTPAEGDGRQSRSSMSRSSSRDNSARRGGDEPSSLRLYVPPCQSPLTSASTEYLGGPVSATKNPVVSKHALSIEEVQKKMSVTLEEFLCNSNYEESEMLVVESFPTHSLHLFVRESLNDMLERSSAARQSVGNLMSHLVKASVIPLDMYLSGLNGFLEFADDLAIDVPKFWPYVAEFIVPMLLAEVMFFSDFREVAQPVRCKLILEVLNLLVKDKGQAWIRQKWDMAGLKWTDFLPADKVGEFVKQNMLEYTLDGSASAPSASSRTPLNWYGVQLRLEKFQKAAPVPYAHLFSWTDMLEYTLDGSASAPSASSSTPVNWDDVQLTLEKFLKKEEAPTSFDHIFSWIDANVGARVKEPQFIRALMTAICSSAIESEKTILKLNERRLQDYKKLMLRYVDTRSELEVQCLYAIQSLIHKLEHPPGLLCNIFQTLWDSCMISNNSFILWQTSENPAEQAGKGVAIKSLTTFLTALGEAYEDSSCEES